MAQKIDEGMLVAMLNEHLRTAIGAPEGKLAKDRLHAWEYYRGQPTGDLAPPEIEGRSRYVSRDVAQTVDWILPSLIEVFTASDEAVVFEGQGPEDEAAAKQATQWCNYVFYRQNAGLLNMHHWFKDALIGRLGVIKVWWDSKKDITTETYRGLSVDAVMMITQNPDMEISGRSEPYADAMGQEVYDVEVKRTKDASKICIEPVPPEEFFYSQYARSAQDCPFMAHVKPVRVSDLRARGYDNLDEAIQSNGEPWMELSVETSYRKQANSNYAYGLHSNSNDADESMREIWVAECYMMVDFNGDGVAEWRKILKSGDVILENEEIDDHPFCLITPDPNPHELAGNSIPDKVMDIQEIKTALVRGILDNTYLTNNQRYLFNTNADLDIDALLDNRPLGIVGTNDMTAVLPLTTPALAPQTFNLLEYVQGDAENRTGVTRYNQGLDSNSLNKTATGVNAIMNASQQRIKLISRIFAETGVKDLFKKILHLTTKYDNKSRIVRLTNGYAQIDPQAWSNGFDLVINVGIGTGNKDQMAAHLTNVLQIQKEALAIGVATPTNIYNAAKKLAENMGFKNGDEYFTDPTKNPPAPPQPDPRLMIEQAKLAHEQEKDKALIAIKAQEVMLKHGKPAEVPMMPEAPDHSFDVWKAQLDSDTKIAVAQIGAMKSPSIMPQAEAPQMEYAADYEEEPQEEEKPDQIAQVLAMLIQSQQESTQALVQTIAVSQEAMAKAVAQSNAIVADAINKQTEVAKAPRHAVTDKDGNIIASEVRL